MYSLAWKACRCCPSNGYKCAGSYYNHLTGQFWSDEECDAMEALFEAHREGLREYERAKRSDISLKLFFGLVDEVPPSAIDTQRTKEELKEALRLSSIVEQSVTIRKVGRDKYQARCPFHNDRLASLSINDDKGLWNCFAGCGGGDVFSWIMKKYDLTFKQAIEVAKKLI